MRTTGWQRTLRDAHRPGIVSLLSELRAHEQQAAQELSQWQTRHLVEERKTIDATPAAVALAMILTAEQLEELEAKMLAQGGMLTFAPELPS